MKTIEDISLIVLDIDGTMTDGGVYIDNNRIECKKFSIKDGAGIKIAQVAGLNFMILTGRESNCVSQRAEELSIKYIFQNVNDKSKLLKKFMQENGYKAENVAYIGDDLNDIKAMKLVSYSACPSDACDEVRQYVDLVLSKKGGDGVVREFVEKILRERNLWTQSAEKLFDN